MGENISVKTDFISSLLVRVGRFTFWILMLTLFPARHVSVSKLLELTVLICKRLALAKLDSSFADLVCKDSMC